MADAGKQGPALVRIVTKTGAIVYRASEGVTFTTRQAAWQYVIAKLEDLVAWDDEQHATARAYRTRRRSKVEP